MNCPVCGRKMSSVLCTDCVIARLTRERDEALEKANQWEQLCLDCRRHDLERILKQIVAAPSEEQQDNAIQAARELLEDKP